MSAHTRAKIKEPLNVHGGASATLLAPTGARVSTDHPLSKAALAELAEAAPRGVTFDDLIFRASERLAIAGATDEQRDDDITAVAANLLQGFSYDDQLIDLRTVPALIAPQPSEHPQVGDVARHFAAKGARTLTNAYHKRVQIEPVHAAIISLANGRRSRQELRAQLDQLIEVNDSADGSATLDGLIDESLAFFADAALLVP